MALHEALIRLILERDYDEISVGDIADAANVGRSTFYAHYTDKDDLLRSGLVHLRSILFGEHAKAAENQQPELHPLWFSRFMTAHLKEQHRLYRALMRGRAGPIVMDRMRELLCELVREAMASEKSRPPQAASSEISVRFVVGAYMSVLTWWLDRGAKEPPEEIDRAFRELAAGALGADQTH